MLPSSNSRCLFDLYGTFLRLCMYLVPRDGQSGLSAFFGSILHTVISSSLHFIDQLIIKHTPIPSRACTPHTHAHTHAYTHILSSVWWGVWTAPTDCASLPLCSGVPVVPSPIAVNATIWCATWTS